MVFQRQALQGDMLGCGARSLGLSRGLQDRESAAPTSHDLKVRAGWTAVYK